MRRKERDKEIDEFEAISSFSRWWNAHKADENQIIIDLYMYS